MRSHLLLLARQEGAWFVLLDGEELVALVIMQLTVSLLAISMVSLIAVHGLRARHHIGGHLAVKSRTLALLLLVRGVAHVGLHLLSVGVMWAQVTATTVVMSA